MAKSPPKAKPGPQALLIKSCRLQRGLTQQQLAERLGVHPKTVQHLESGRKTATSAELIGKMADLFGRDPDHFYITAYRIPPDMQDYIAHNHKLMQQIRMLMDKQAAKPAA